MKSRHPHKPKQTIRTAFILLVEDSPSDARLTIEALREGDGRHEVVQVTDAEKAFAYLRQEGELAEAQRPDLVLLDLNLPGRSGLEVLREMKQDDQLRSIPIVVLSTSNDERDIATCYGLGANCYVSKPVDLGEFMGLVRMIDSFFFRVAKLPPRRPGAA